MKESVMKRSIVGLAVMAIAIGLSMVLAAAVVSAQTPLQEKRRDDADYQQRLLEQQNRSNAATEAARARAEEDARRRAAEQSRQQSQDSARQQQLDDLNKRFRADQPQPNLSHPYQ
jgi:biopolymer transport protein ExbB/TolQ